MGADFEKAKREYPTVNLRDTHWQRFFSTGAGEDAMAKIIADVYSEIVAEEEKEKGIRRMGRRPRPEVVPIQDVMGKVFPVQYSLEPFPTAIAELMKRKKMSARALALRVPVHQTTMSKYIAGKLEPDVVMLEQIAAALKVNPWYFREWRAGYLAEVVQQALENNPRMSISMVNLIRKLRVA